MERTLLVVKPDGVGRGLVGEILGRIERAGLMIVGLSMRHLTEDFARDQYPSADRYLERTGARLRATADEHGISLVELLGTDDPVKIGRIVFERNVRFLASGPVVAAVVEGFNAVRKTRLICGSTMPSDALPGTIRGDYSSVGEEQIFFTEWTVRNLVHSSDADEDAGNPEREIARWFPDDCMCAPLGYSMGDSSSGI
jgi:nucleoside-diphosphate kinase